MSVIADLLQPRIEADRARVDESARAELETAVLSVYRANADFVWKSLQRLGVRDVDLDDVLQEVFVVVQKRLGTFDGSAKMTTWLFGICLRVASAYRRRSFRRRETSVAELPEDHERATASPEEDLAAREARRRLGALLDELDLDKRAVLVMFEIDEMPCEEIAQILGVPVGTVHSRLHAARKAFQKALARMQAHDLRREAWSR